MSTATDEPAIAMTWRRYAECLGSELFWWPEKGLDHHTPDGQAELARRYRAMQKVCARCMVAQDCIEDAMADPLAYTARFLVRGGLTYRDRMALLRLRREMRETA